MTEQTEFQAIDTFNIQMDSLLNVMDSLGYRLDRIGVEGDKRPPTGGFITHIPGLQANRNLGLTTAVKIHNLERKEWLKLKEGWYKLPFEGIDICMSAYALNVLYARKLVEKVKFLKNRNIPSHIELQSNMVKPANRAYIPLLGLEA